MALVLRQLGTTALFAGRFREAAGRALLLPGEHFRAAELFSDLPAAVLAADEASAA